MYNPNVDIKKWFYTNLVSATGLGVYDGIAPDTAGNKYLILTGRTSSQVQGNIVTKNANFGFKDSEAISNQILAAINSDTHITLPTGWNASSLSVAGIRNIQALNPLDNVFRTLLTYNLTITQTQ
jgi:hypothetical protein